MLLLLLACNPPKKTTDESAAPPITTNPDGGTVGTNLPEVVKSQGPNSRVICKAPAGVNNDPRSIADFVKLVNALPKPTSVACVIDSLKGPFRVNATASAFSAQPAESRDIPRIFLFFKPLLISIVPAGEGGKVIELSDRTSPEGSIKGEIPFPLNEQISMDYPYEHIKAVGAEGTVCRNCHPGEVVAPAPYPPIAYVSQFVPAFHSHDVSAAEIETSAKRCLTSKLRECQVLEALTSKGPLVQEEFD